MRPGSDRRERFSWKRRHPVLGVRDSTALQSAEWNLCYAMHSIAVQRSRDLGAEMSVIIRDTDSYYLPA